MDGFLGKLFRLNELHAALLRFTEGRSLRDEGGR